MSIVNILIVDDDPEDRLLITRQLSKHLDEVRFLEADRIGESIAKIAEFPIDIVLLDLSLIETDGLKTLLQFKSIAPELPVVVLTGTTDDDIAKQAIELGAQEFVRKSEIANPWLYRCIRNAMQRHQLQQELKRQSLKDPLTRLPNRLSFESHLESTFGNHCKNTEAFFTVVFIDLDEFKLINDCYGHAEGDRVLVEFSARLKTCIRSSDIVARFGGDEFVVLLKSVRSDEDVKSFVRRLNASLDQSIVVDGVELYLSASVGYVSSCNKYSEFKDMLRDADTAMYEAKKAGKKTHRKFSRPMREKAVEKIGMDSRLRQALENEEFEVFYQPIVNLSTERISKLEALTRWNHPTEGLISPASFIPHAERTGLIVPLGQWVLKSVCEQIEKWDALYPGNSIRVCVNVSPDQICVPGFATNVLKTIESARLDGNRIVLEITESTIMENPEQTIKVLQAIRDNGTQISIDDFGTGYSSLAKLHRFGFDTLKIDRSFVKELLTEGYADLLVKTILLLADSIGLEVIAEGIETPEQAARLWELGCSVGQGFLFGKPMLFSEASRLVAELATDGQKPTRHEISHTH